MRMWLRAGRSGVLNRALAALLAVVVCGGALDWGHAGGDDPDCNPVPVYHDHAAHRFAPAPSHSSPSADHCYICHSLRLLQTTVIARGARVILTVNSTPLCQANGLSASGPLGETRSSRAPPAISL